MKTVLVAGATGAIGTVLIPLLRSEGHRVIPHVRTKTAQTHPLGKDPDAFIGDLGEAAKLDAAMKDVDTVVCLVGTMRRRFAQGDTYESSDYQPVVDLVEAAKRTKRPIHFVLLTAYGARPGNGYLGWKFRAEEVVRKSGLPYVVLQPSFLDTTGSGSNASDGTQRKPPPLVGGTLKLAGAIPGMRGISDDLRPIPAEVLCRAIARMVKDGSPNASTVTGRQLWTAAALR